MSVVQHCRHSLEDEIRRVVIHFEKEFMGRGPLEAQAYVLDDMILVRLKGVLTPAEQKLASANSSRSGYLLKQVRNELLTSGRPLLESLVRDIVKIDVQSVHTDISTKTGERVIVFTLNGRLEFTNSRDVNGHAQRTCQVAKSKQRFRPRQD